MKIKRDHGKSCIKITSQIASKVVVIGVLVTMVFLWKEFWNFLNANSNGLMILVTCVIGFITYRYVQLTRDIAYETKTMREMQAQPHIIINFLIDEKNLNNINISIENVGNLPAENLRFKVVSDIEYTDQKKFSELPLIKAGLKYFSSKQKIEFFLCNVAEKIEKGKDLLLEFEMTYSNSELNKDFNEKVSLDLSKLIELRKIG